MRADMLDVSADRRLCRIGARDVLGHWLARGLAAVNAALENVGLRPCLALAAAIGAVSPDISGSIGGIDHPPQLAPVTIGGRGHRCLADNPNRRSMLICEL